MPPETTIMFTLRGSFPGSPEYNYQVYENETCFQALLLDVLGDHKTAEEYFETLLALQGSRNFPGLHQGPYDAVFHGVRVDEQYDYTASDYGLDHGTVLWSLAEHYLYTRDRAWMDRVWPRMRRAIDWIVAQRASTRLTDAKGAHVREYGLLPASHLEDNADWAQWFAINAYCWAGIDRSAEALKDMGHPDAAALRREADAYQRHEIPAAIRSLYNSFVSCLYPDVNLFTEEYRTWSRASGPFYKTPDEARFSIRLRDALALEDGGALWLASGTPRRWLEPGDGIQVDRLETYFGPVSYTLKAGGQAGVLEAALKLPSRRPAGKIYLVARVPRGRIRAVTVNGRPWTGFDPARESIELPPDAAAVRIEYR